MKELLKKVVINVVGWTVVVILAFIHAPIVRPICQIPYYGWFLAILVGGLLFLRLIKSIIALFKQKKFLFVTFTILQIILFCFIIKIVNSRWIDETIALFHKEFWSLIFGAYVISLFCKKNELDRNFRWRTATIFALTLVAIPKVTDDEPIENDWTIEQIVTNSDDFSKSYNQLKKFMEKSTGFEKTITSGILKVSSPIKVEPELKVKMRNEIDQIPSQDSRLTYAKLIEQAWKENSELIKEFEKLNQFSVVTSITSDLTSLLDYDLEFENFKAIYKLYYNKILLEAEQEKFESAIERFRTVHAITLKGSRGPNSLLSFMTWRLACVIDNSIALDLVKLPNFPENLVSELLTIFDEIDLGQSYEQMVKIEYVMLREWFKSGRSIWDFQPNKLEQFLFFKANRSFNNLREYCQMAIDENVGIPKKKPEYMIKIEEELKDFEPTNIMGWLWDSLSTMYPYFYKGMWEVKVKNEILRLKLTEMIDGDTSQFIDPYTEKPFVKNKDGEYYSPGPDRKFDTEDDITL